VEKSVFLFFDKCGLELHLFEHKFTECTEAGPKNYEASPDRKHLEIFSRRKQTCIFQHLENFPGCCFFAKQTKREEICTLMASGCRQQCKDVGQMDVSYMQEAAIVLRLENFYVFAFLQANQAGRNSHINGVRMQAAVHERMPVGCLVYAGGCNPIASHHSLADGHKAVISQRYMLEPWI
jgi:hypothetical protein